MRFPVATVAYLMATSSIRYSRASPNVSSAFVSLAGGSNSFSVTSNNHRPQARTNSSSASFASSTSSTPNMVVDPQYPGTALERLHNVHKRIQELDASAWNGRWEDVRRNLLWAGGLKDLPDAIPGQGYTGHSFNDFNHVDLTCMNDGSSDNENDGSVKGIAVGNRLGNGIRIASLPELGPGGSWSTCALGCDQEPPRDVAHIQFQARIAFKLVWVPNDNFDTFVLVDDAGRLLAQGTPSSLEGLPPLRERQRNYQLVQGSKYAKEADRLARSSAVAAAE